MISITILAKNAQETLGATLDSCKRFPEVLLLDTGSSDSTKQIAQRYSNVRIIEDVFRGFGPSHNVASEKARFDWILSLDSDEVLTPELTEEILSLPLDEKTVYEIHRSNYFHNRQIRCCSGWYPDWNVRLFHRKTTGFDDKLVHENVRTAGLKIKRLKADMIHTPYRSVESLLMKMQMYSSLFAEQNAGKKKASFASAWLHGIGAFFKNYFLKRGCFGGKEGFIISLYNAQTTYYKYLKLAWRNKSL